MSVFKIVEKEFVCHIANWLVLFLILQSIIICPVKFFLYNLLYTSFSSFKTEYIYGKQYSQEIKNSNAFQHKKQDTMALIIKGRFRFKGSSGCKPHDSNCINTDKFSAI